MARRGVPLSASGSVGALVGFALAMSPSLLPRGWAMQGAIAGISAATGYGVGVLLAAVTRRLLRLPPAVRRPLPRLGLAVGALLVAAVTVAGTSWQRTVHALTGLRPPPYVYGLGAVAVTVVVTVSLVAAARAVRRGERLLARWLGRWTGPRVARIGGVAGVVVLGLGLGQGVVVEGLLTGAQAGFARLDEGTSAGIRPPGADRSGGPGSLVPWASLGREGRDFVGKGPTVAQLSRFSGKPALDPIRVYVGLRSASSPQEQARLAVRELERTGGFSRAVLCVVTTLGTGSIDSEAADSLEYLWNGDTALVGIEYSYLPSYLSYVADTSRATTAGRALFDAVYSRWAQLPKDHRPRLLVFGESLGALGSQAAFSSLSDVLARTDGALWIAPPVGRSLPAELAADRETGSPAWQPVYDDGTHVRFAARPSDLLRPATVWQRPRVVILRHASDPVVWWSTDLIWRRPDWLSEPKGPDVVPAMRWVPFVTFWQVTADLLARDVPPGHGHNYHLEKGEAWAAIASPPGWTAADTARLHALMASRPGVTHRGSLDE